MSKDTNIFRDKISGQKIVYSDTMSSMCEKYNNNLEIIVEYGGGPEGPEGPDGPQGAPTKPKNPVHVWIEGEHYDSEIPSGISHEIIGIMEDLSDVKYQEGHCIFLENGHVYVLETIGYNLVPVYRVAMQSYNPGTVVDGRNSYVHFAYANSSDGYDGFITGDEIRGEEVSTFNLRRMAAPVAEDDEVSRSYMGVYSDHSERSSNNPSSYIWMKIQGGMGLPGLQGEQGPAGPAGPTGPKGDRGDAYTGHLYFIDLEGDMATINIDIDRTRLYDESNDYCECVLHAYYGNDSWKLPKSDVSLEIPKDDDGNDIGTFTLIQDNNDVRIRFVPDENYVFPIKNLQIPITVKTKVDDPDNKETYDFERKTIWIIKPIMATFELEIRPAYRIIKIYEDGERYPKNLEVFVYKIEDTKRSLFDLSEESDFTLLWKYQDDDEWNEYTSPIPTEKSSCLELQIVRYWKSTDPEKQEEIWDYEDVWTVADGKGTHYYHADLGNAESMLVLTTGEKLPISDASDLEDINENYIAELRDPNGYSIIFEPHFYDGSTPLKVLDVDLATSAFDMENLYNGRFDYTFENITSDSEGSSESAKMQYKFTVTQVPYGISMIPLSFNVLGEYVELDQNGEPMIGSDGNPITEEKIDAVSFNIYISEIANIYSLQPSVTTFNTSKGVAYDKDNNEVVCDTIGCSVFRNGQQISSDDDDLKLYNLTLKWVVFQEDGEAESKIYTEPLVFGLDDDIDKDHFQSNDVMIEFILYYGKKEIVKSTVPLIKDGIDGRDGESWQYIFVRSNYYPFESAQEKDKILNPSDWKKIDEITGENVSSDPNRKDNASEYLGPDGTTWVDDHQGVDIENRYEYQSYRRWDVVKKEWGIYYPPTLYSNYAKDGVDGSGFLTTFSNPVAVIPVGENGYKCEENNVNQKDSTEVYFYNGSQNLSKYEELEISIDENSEWRHHFEPKRGADGIWNIFFTPVVTNGDGSESIFDFGDEGNRFSIGINVRYGISSDVDGDGNDEFYEGFVRWTLSPMKGLEDYEVFVDRHVVNITSDTDTTFRVGYYKITTNGGKSFVEKYNPADGMNIKIHNNIDLDDLENVEYVDSWGECYYNFGNSDRCYVILLDKDGDIVDYTSVEAVTDGKDGYNGYHLELTQDYIALPWNEDRTGVNAKYDDSKETGKPIYSKMVLYRDNYEEIESGIEYEIIGLKENTGYEYELETDDEGNETGGFTIPKEMFDGDNNLTCRATYQNVVYEKVLFVDLEDTPYELELNKSILQRDQDTGKLIDESISVKVRYWMDGDWHYTSDGKVVLTCDNIEGMLSDNGTDSDKQYTRKILFTDDLINNKKDRDVRISYYETKGGSIIGEELSYEIIGILDNGKTGSSPYRLDLSNENVTLACDSEGKVYGTGYDENGLDSDSDPSDDIITTTVTLFYGADVIKLSPEEVYVTCNNKDISSDEIEDNDKDGIIEYTLPATFLNSLEGSNNSINFKVKIPNSTIELNATMSICKIKSSYRYYLRPSVSTVVRYEDGSYSDGVTDGIIKCALWKQDGSKKPVEVTDGEIVSSIIKYKFDETSDPKPYSYDGGVSITSDCKEIWFEAIEGDVLWDREIVPVLKDGKDGKSPSCIKVDVLGYSKVSGLPLYPNETLEDGKDMFEEWKTTIADVQADKGDTVYILQEYTWRPVDAGDDSSKDTKTRGITSTVAGVQGSNGRILFYLGSFEKDKETFFDINEDGEKVIRDFIYGRLTKTVCDYYIDFYGQAWMRTGSEDAEGSDGQKGGRYGNDGSSYWEPAQKVGFLQAGAITADMINVGTLVADEIFVNKLKASELEVEKSIVNQLDDKITNSTAIAKIKADNEESLMEFRNTFTTEGDVNGLIEDAEAGIISKAQEGMAEASMFAQYTKTTELDGVISTKLSNAGVITTTNAEESLANMFASKKDVDGKVSKASIIAEINSSNESNVKISADKITLEGLKLESANKSLEINLEDGQSYFGKQDETYIQINPDDASIHLQGEGDKWSITSEAYSNLNDIVTFDRNSTGVINLYSTTMTKSRVQPYMPSTAGYGTFQGASGDTLVNNLAKYGTLIGQSGGNTRQFTGLKKGAFRLYQTDTWQHKLSTYNVTAKLYTTNSANSGTYTGTAYGELYFVFKFQITGTINSNVKEKTIIHKQYITNSNFSYNTPLFLANPIDFSGELTQDNSTLVLITSVLVYYVEEWAAATRPTAPYADININLTHSNDLILDVFDKEGRYEIFRNGFIFMSDYKHLCSSIGGKSFTAINNDYGIHIAKYGSSPYEYNSKDGLYILYGGQWLKVDIDMHDDDTGDFITNLDMSRVKLINVTSDFEF